MSVVLKRRTETSEYIVYWKNTVRKWASFENKKEKRNDARIQTQKMTCVRAMNALLIKYCCIQWIIACVGLVHAWGIMHGRILPLRHSHISVNYESFMRREKHRTIICFENDFSAMILRH